MHEPRTRFEIKGIAPSRRERRRRAAETARAAEARRSRREAPAASPNRYGATRDCVPEPALDGPYRAIRWTLGAVVGAWAILAKVKGSDPRLQEAAIGLGILITVLATIPVGASLMVIAVRLYETRQRRRGRVPWFRRVTARDGLARLLGLGACLYAGGLALAVVLA